jgi:hypothetical protein
LRFLFLYSELGFPHCFTEWLYVLRFNHGVVISTPLLIAMAWSSHRIRVKFRNVFLYCMIAC